jgi:type I restriction enzyme M protein
MENSASTNIKSHNIIQSAYDVLHTEGFHLPSEVSSVVPYLMIWLRAGYPLQRFQSVDQHTHFVLPEVELLGVHTVDSHLSYAKARAGTINYLEASIRSLPLDALHRILDILATLRLAAMSQAEFVEVFDYALEYPFQSSPREFGQYFMPVELVQFIAQAFPIRPGESVFNPYANTCQLAGFLNSDTQLFSQEPNQQVQALGMLRLTAHRLHKAIIVAQDPMQSWPLNREWDVVLATAPILDFRLSSPSSASGLPSNARLDTTLIQRTLNSLSEGGRAIIPVAPAFLWRSGRSQVAFRKLLADSGCLYAVIELPNGLLASTGIGLSLLLIQKKSVREQHNVLFLDAEPHVTGRRNSKLLNVDSLLNALHSQQENEYCRFVALDELAASEYNLSAHRYLTRVEEHPDDVALGDIAQFQRRSRPVSSAIGRIVGIQHLLNESSNYGPSWFNLNWADLPSESVDQSVIPISENALLLATKGEALKPTWFEFVPEANVLLANGVVALRVDLKRVDVEYLITELNSDHVLQQVKARQVGSTFPTLTCPDMLQLRVRLPKEIAQQSAIVDRVREQLAKQKQKEIDALRVNREQKAESLQQFAALKHALSTHQLTLSSDIANLEDVIKQYATENRVLTLDSRLNDVQTVTVQDTIDTLKHAVEFFFRTLDRNEYELVLENYPLKPIEMIGYLRRLVSRTNTSAHSYSISFKGSQQLLLLEYFNKSKQSTIYIQANEYLLDMIFDNILNNAERHGFKGIQDVNNKVAIYAAYTYFDDNVSPKLSIRISNNGAPFPLKFDSKQLFRKGEPAGETGNTGIGGYQVKEIVHYFGGQVKASSSTKDPDSTVVYTITLPIAAAETTDPDVEDL